jgi:poly(A) polymerase
MTEPATRAVLAAIQANGARVRFVGGCVRDSLLARPITDIDIATPDPPSVVINLLKEAEVHAIPTGIEHGTVTAVFEGRHFEITTLRHDIETFGRRARVAYTDDWVIDATRRDFTINALYCDPDGAIFDPTGGLVDLDAGHVRFVGDPVQRIDEDFLRILRFFRFQAYFGRTPPDETALAACRARAHNLGILSAERVCGELLRLLAAPEPAEALRLMAAFDVLDQVLPEARAIPRLERLVELERETGGDPLRRLAAVLEVDGTGAAAVAERLRMSNAQKEQLVVVAARPVKISAKMEAKAARRALYAVGAERFRDLVLIGWAEEEDGHANDWRRLIASADDWHPPELPVRGADVIHLGVAEGPRVGEIMAAIEAWWIDGDFAADRDTTLAELKRLVGQSDDEG